MEAPARRRPLRRGRVARGIAAGTCGACESSLNPRSRDTYNPSVALLRDWLALGKNTIDSLTTDDVARLYSNEWAETRSVLLADHQHAIEQERRRFRRWIRIGSAMMHGLVKRLSPVRRLLFALG